MPRRKKTQPARAPGLEAGAAYGEKGDNLAAQNPSEGGIPLPQREAAPPPSAPAAPQPLPVDAARGFTPQVTPLLAPGTGRDIVTPRPRITSQQRSATLLRNWAEATGDPLLARAAQQIGRL